MKYSFLVLPILTLSTLFTTVSCRSTGSSDSKSVDDIQSMSRNGRGFSVVCAKPNSSDIYQETYNSAADYQAAVSQNKICGGTTGGGGNSDFICKPYTSDTAYVYSVSRSSEIGSTVPFKRCLSIIKSIKNDFVCKPYTSDTAYIYNFVKRSELGSTTTIDNCIGAIQAANRFICKPYTTDTSYLFYLAGDSEIGSTVPSPICQRIAAASTGNLTCKPYTSSSFYLYDIIKKSEVGSTSSLDNCLAQVAP